MTQILLWSTLVLMTVVLYVTQRNELKWKKNIILGVTLPQEARQHPQVLALMDQYRKQLGWSTGLYLLLCALGFVLFREFSSTMVAWTLLLVLWLVLPMVLFARINGKLKDLKRREGWVRPRQDTVQVDLGTMLPYEPPKARWFLLPALVLVLPLALEPGLWPYHLGSLVMVIFSYAAARFLYRKKAETVDGDVALTRTLSRLRYQNWQRMWLILAWDLVILAVSFGLLRRSPLASTVLMILGLVLTVTLILLLEFRVRRLQERLTASSGSDWYVDEDDYWLWGLFYYNPHDSHTLVNSRIGTGSTFNLATVPGKIISALSVLLVLGACLLLVVMAGQDQAPISLTLTQDALVSECGFSSYEIPLADVQSVELLETLPEGLFRTNGYGGQYLLQGSFTGGGMLHLKLLLDPTQAPFLLLELPGEQFYLLNTRSPSQTQALFQQLGTLIHEN